MDTAFLQKVFTAGVFYMPFIGFLGFGIFVFILGISTLITGTIVFFVFAVYGIYAFLRDMGYIQYCIEKSKGFLNRMDVDILRNIDQSFTLQGKENLPEGQTLFLCHPHGILGLGWFYHFCHAFRPWPFSERRPYLAIHSFLFKFPFLRELLESCGCIESSEKVLERYLQQGESVAIITGGAEEMMYSDAGSLNLVLKKRKGYARLAKKFQIPVVPLLSTNENKIFPQHSSFLWKGFSSLLFRLFRICFPLPSWTAVKNWMQILKSPLPEPVCTIVLKPIETQNKSVEAIQKETIQRIQGFLESEKIQFQFIG
jgi:1-acyl-sn-glycerol-3-phosphate acyltransferase